MPSLVFVCLQANGYIAGMHDNKATEPETPEEGAPSAQCTVRPCILNCNGRGRSVNDTCHCEPIYSGSDCSIDLMAEAADDLLEGVAVPPPVPNSRVGLPGRRSVPLSEQ